MVNTGKLHFFTHNKNLNKRIRKQLGWSQVVANVALNAYQEFLELKIVTRDYETSHIVPSWCVREVWKTHAVCDPTDYEEGCRGLCGKIIKYQVKKEPHEADYNEMFTVKVYKIRFNRGLSKPIWSFKFDPNWKNEYQTEKDLKYSKRVENKGEAATNKTADKSPKSISTNTFYSSNKGTLKGNVKENDKDTQNNSTENEVNNTVEHTDPLLDVNTLNTSNDLQQSMATEPRRLRSTQNSSSSLSSSGSPEAGQRLTNRRSSGQKRPTPSRNPIMTRARTKMLRLDPY